MNFQFGIFIFFCLEFFNFINDYFKIPNFYISDVSWWILFSYFITDFSLTIIWSLIHLPPNKHEKKLIVSGPYYWTRHPVYSTNIWREPQSNFDLQFMVSYVFCYSVSLIWSWIVMKEEIRLNEIFKNIKYSTEPVFFPKFDK